MTGIVSQHVAESPQRSEVTKTTLSMVEMSIIALSVWQLSMDTYFLRGDPAPMGSGGAARVSLLDLTFVSSLSEFLRRRPNGPAAFGHAPLGLADSRGIRPAIARRAHRNWRRRRRRPRTAAPTGDRERPWNLFPAKRGRAILLRHAPHGSLIWHARPMPGHLRDRFSTLFDLRCRRAITVPDRCAQLPISSSFHAVRIRRRTRPDA